jgi:rhodanese-related sulfurtransferase
MPPQKLRNHIFIALFTSFFTVSTTFAENLDKLYLDVRSPGEWRTGYIENSIHIPLYELASRADSLSEWKNKKIITVCETGKRSEKAASILKQKGYLHVTNLEGGLNIWRQNNNPIINKLIRYQDNMNDMFSNHNWGMYVRTINVPSKTLPNIGLRVETIFPSSSAEEAGIEYGDVIVGINGESLNLNALENKKTYQDFFPKGQQLNLTIIRNSKTINKLLNTKIHPKEVDTIHNNDSLEYKALTRAMKTLLPIWGSMYFPIVRSIISDPKSVSKFAPSILDNINTKQNSFDVVISALNQASTLFDVDIIKTQINPPSALSIDSLIEHIVTIFEKIDYEIDQALLELSQDEIEFLKLKTNLFLDSYSKSIFIHDLEDDAQIRDMFKYRKLANKVHIKHLLQASYYLSSFLKPSFAQSLKQLSKNSIETSIFSTRIGQIAIGGQKDDTYNEHLAAIIDFGGNNSYKFSSDKIPRLIIDVSGDDSYQFTDDANPALVPFQVRLLYDLQGNDTYKSTTSMTIGSGILGTSFLIDESGNDLYHSSALSQGAGIFGIGVLIDIAGNDIYTSTAMSQGFGGTRGIGMLIDFSGDDIYKVSKSGLIDCEYCNFSQGAGGGMPSFAQGGIGILYSGSGNDTFEAHEYAQGVGYYGALGILINKSGDDTYQGKLYNQGAGVHGAIGILYDSLGDDTYNATVGRSQAAGWDLGIGYLHDSKGNDKYNSQGESQSYSAQNSFSYLFDIKGVNLFFCANETMCEGKTGGNTYANGRSAGSIALVESK